MMSSSRSSGRLGPFIAPAAIGALAALVEIGGEPLRLVFRYEREALAAGELWRLVTGHLVHLSPSHMLMNVVALGVLALIFADLLTRRDWFAGGLAAALAIDAGLYFVSTEVAWYVGLSGVLHGYWAAACIRATAAGRREAVALSVMILVKLTYEAVIGPVPFTGDVAAGPVVAVAHTYGAAGGALTAFVMLATRPRVRSI